MNSFDDLKAAGFSQDDIDSLESQYEHVDDIDLFTGGEYFAKRYSVVEVGIFLVVDCIVHPVTTHNFTRD